MYIKAEGTARIRHKDTGVVYDMEADELDWDAVGADERGMGSETIWAAEVDHPELGELRWEMSEYPIGVANFTINDINGHEALQDFDVGIEHEPDGPDDDDYEPPFDRTAAEEEMTTWFHQNYEDPANSLPYNTREGGYQWVNGGPYAAVECLEGRFRRKYPFDFIEEVAGRIVDESGGSDDWTPVHRFDGEEYDEAQALANRFSLAEELVQNANSGLFDVRPKEISKPDLLGATLSQVSDAIEDVLATPSNGLNEQSLEIRRLRRTLDRYANDPQRVEMDLTFVHGSLLRQIANGEMPLSGETQALLVALQEGAQGIRATDLEVAQNRRLLQEQALSELSPTALAQVAEAAPLIAAITEGNLQKQMGEDIRFLTQEMYVGPPRLPGVTRADAIVPGRDEAVRVFGRSARMLMTLRNSGADPIHKLHDSAGFKITTVIMMLADLVKLGLGLFD